MFIEPEYDLTPQLLLERNVLSPINGLGDNEGAGIYKYFVPAGLKKALRGKA